MCRDLITPFSNPDSRKMRQEYLTQVVATSTQVQRYNIGYGEGGYEGEEQGYEGEEGDMKGRNGGYEGEEQGI